MDTADPFSWSFRRCPVPPLAGLRSYEDSSHLLLVCDVEERAHASRMIRLFMWLLSMNMNLQSIQLSDISRGVLLFAIITLSVCSRYICRRLRSYGSPFLRDAFLERIMDRNAGSKLENRVTQFVKKTFRRLSSPRAPVAAASPEVSSDVVSPPSLLTLTPSTLVRVLNRFRLDDLLRLEMTSREMRAFVLGHAKQLVCANFVVLISFEH